MMLLDPAAAPLDAIAALLREREALVRLTAREVQARLDGEPRRTP